MIIAGDKRSAPGAGCCGGAEPVELRHEIVAQHLDARSAHVDNKLLELLDLPVSSCCAQLDFVAGRHGFDNDQIDSGISKPLL
ncbi:hypothetical protein D3C78_1450310 [compost metagenome]